MKPANQIKAPALRKLVEQINTSLGELEALAGEGDCFSFGAILVVVESEPSQPQKGFRLAHSAGYTIDGTDAALILEKLNEGAHDVSRMLVRHVTKKEGSEADGR